MPQTDLPLDQLWDYRPELPEPAGLDEFWATTLTEAAQHPLTVTTEPYDSGLVAIETFDVTFAGYGGHPVKAWLHLPAASARPAGALPGVVQYIGYNGGRGLAHENTFWAAAGFAHLVMDTRGQGSGWMVGDTPDPAAAGGPSQPGFLTRGIAAPEEHFYRRVFVDAVRAVEVLRQRPETDAARVSVAGISQGGGIALGVSALVEGLAAVMPDVPFLCDFRRAAQIAFGDPYAEITRYLAAHRDRADQTFEVLAHFDGAILGRRAGAPALFSVALMDQTCPPSTVFAAYHSYSGPKEIEIYSYNDHEGGQAFQQIRQLRWLRSLLDDSTGGQA